MMSAHWEGPTLLLGVENAAERSVARIGDRELWVSGRDLNGNPVMADMSIEAILPLAMLVAAEQGDVVEVDAELARDDIVRLNFEFAPIMQGLFELEHRPRVVPRGITTTPTPASKGSGVGLTFSAGVDSFYSLEKLTEAGIRPTHFVNIHAGASDDNPVTWQRRLANVGAVARELDVGLLSIDTNFHRIWTEPHVKTHTVRNICAMLAFRNILGAGYYSSTHDYRSISFEIAMTGIISHFEAVFLRMMAPAGFELGYVGLEATRRDKTMAVAADPLVARHLDVCTDQEYQAERRADQPINCGRCAKCVRTQATLEHLGQLGHFGMVFDLAAWARDRATNFGKLQASRYELDQEVVEMLGLAEAHAPQVAPLKPEAEDGEAAALRAEIATIRASESFRLGNAVAKAYRFVRGRPLD
jgi:hypothetical protein